MQNPFFLYICLNNQNRDAHSVLPAVITGLGIALLSYKRYKSRKYASSDEVDELIVSLKKRRSILISLTALESIGWLYFFVQNTLNSNQNVYDALSLAALFITWVKYLKEKSTIEYH